MHFNYWQANGGDGIAQRHGLSEQIVFPEISIDDVEFVQGLNIALTIKNSSDEESLALLDLFGFPFRR